VKGFIPPRVQRAPLLTRQNALLRRGRGTSGYQLIEAVSDSESEKRKIELGRSSLQEPPFLPTGSCTGDGSPSSSGTEFGRSLTDRAKKRAELKYLTLQFVED
jgi:hypothetical protein